ncbi:MAG: anhydro-N-acetylmuramic acid kinase [Rhodospirillaceae bacterium]|nr:anhydro-N-acetylmuramic acid kinase [Rhodospirillaceae bacterium]
MSGTSIDGVDAALIDTDGIHQIDRLAFHSMPYEPEFADRVRAILGRAEADAEIATVERELTMLHAKAVGRLLESAGVGADSVGVVGFHGHTIHHEPARGFTWQIGDGALLAAECGIDVVACRRMLSGIISIDIFAPDDFWNKAPFMGENWEEGDTAHLSPLPQGGPCLKSRSRAGNK